jgi:hypothetical protein
VIKLNKFGFLSISLFLLGAFIYGISVFSTPLFSGPVTLTLVILLPIIGLLLASKSNGFMKEVAIAGNCAVLFAGVIWPAIMSLFWNTPFFMEK